MSPCHPALLLVCRHTQPGDCGILISPLSQLFSTFSYSLIPSPSLSVFELFLLSFVLSPLTPLHGNELLKKSLSYLLSFSHFALHQSPIWPNYSAEARPADFRLCGEPVA